jgi:hypothetical protein
MTEVDVGGVTDALGYLFGEVDDILDGDTHERPDRRTRTRRERVEDALAAVGSDTPIRAAVGKLSSDQSMLLVDLLDGFGTRRELIEWQQDMAIHSLGQLDDEWFVRSAYDSTTVSALLGRPWGQSDGFDESTAEEIRRSFAAKFVLPAFHDALRTFRWSAIERVDHLDDDVDDDRTPIENPDRQQYPAMRPELGELNDRQEWALSELLDGFEDGEEVLIWAQQVTAASYAEIDSETVTRAYFERPIRRYLTGSNGDQRRARFMRESWAAKYLLPSFNRAARALASRSTEVASNSEGGDYDNMTGSIS